MPSERGPQEKHNGANFCFVALSSEELFVHKELIQNQFWPKASRAGPDFEGSLFVCCCVYLICEEGGLSMLVIN